MLSYSAVIPHRLKSEVNALDGAEMILSYLQAHPQSAELVNRGYQNVVAFRLPDQVIFPQQAALFPDDRLNAFRLADDFIRHHRRLVNWLAELINPDEPTTPAAIWLTLSHVTATGVLFIEVSFE